MSITLLTPILIMFVSALSAVNAIRGYRPGVIRAAGNFACVAASAFLGALISMLVGIIFDDGIIRYIERLGLVIVASEYGIFSEIVRTVAVMLFCSVLFILIFVIVFAVVKIIVTLVRNSKETHPEASGDTYLSENATFLEKNNNRFGALVGVFCGIFISIALMSPFTGILTSIPGLISIIEEADDSGKLEISEELYVAREYSDDLMVLTFDALGGGLIFDITTTTFYQGESTNISSEVRAMKNIKFEEISDALKNITSGDANFSKQFQKLLDSTEDSVFARVLILTSIKDMANSWLAGEDYPGVERPDLPNNKAVDRFFDEVFGILSTTELNTMSKDVKSLLSLCNIVNEYSALFEDGGYGEIIDALLSGDIIADLNAEIKANPRMAPLEKAVDNIVMQMVAEEINKLNPTVKETVYARISTALTSTSGITISAARIDALSEQISSAFSEYELYASEDLARKISTKLLSDLVGDRSYISYFEVRDYFDSQLYNYIK